MICRSYCFRLTILLVSLSWSIDQNTVDAFSISQFASDTLITRSSNSCRILYATKETESIAETTDLDSTAEAIASLTAEIDTLEAEIITTEEETTPPPVEPEPEPTAEEQTSLRLSSTSKGALGMGSQASLQTARLTIKSSKEKTQRRLEKAAFEKEKAAKKIAQLKADMDAATKKVEIELQAQMVESQEKIDEEIARISSLLEVEIESEKKRESQVADLIKSLRDDVSMKEKEISSEEAITVDMEDVKSKLKKGTILSSLETLLEQKNSVTAIERKILSDLVQCVDDMEIVRSDSKALQVRLEETRQNIVKPSASSDVQYEWSDLETMEDTLEQAAISRDASKAKLNIIKNDFNNLLIERAAVLGEEPPPSIRTTTQKARTYENTDQPIKSRNEKTREKLGVLLNEIQPAKTLDKMSEKGEKELLTTAATLFGQAAIKGGKTALFGVKALLESAKAKDVAGAAKETLETTVSDVTKTTKKVQSAGGILDEKDAIGQTAKAALDGVGKTGKAFVSNVGTSNSAKEAAEAARDTSKDLISALSAVAAFGVKIGKKAVDKGKN